MIRAKRPGGVLGTQSDSLVVSDNLSLLTIIVQLACRLGVGCPQSRRVGNLGFRVEGIAFRTGMPPPPHNVERGWRHFLRHAQTIGNQTWMPNADMEPFDVGSNIVFPTHSPAMPESPPGVTPIRVSGSALNSPPRRVFRLPGFSQLATLATSA